MKRKTKIQKQINIDLSHLEALQIVTASQEYLTFVLVGCGGTGSYMAHTIVRLARLLTDQGRNVEVAFFDDDIIKVENIPRQNFCDAEIGMNKAQALAFRTGSAWNIPVHAISEKFTKKSLKTDGRMNIYIGCLDNAAARREINSCLPSETYHSGKSWWLDCGNMNEAGQVLLGSTRSRETVRRSITKMESDKLCYALPSPGLQAPDLLIDRPEEKAKTKLSCNEIAMLNSQSLMVNQAVASIAGDYLVRLTMGQLFKFATYFDLATGSARSLATTPEIISKAIA